MRCAFRRATNCSEPMRRPPAVIIAVRRPTRAATFKNQDCTAASLVATMSGCRVRGPVGDCDPGNVARRTAFYSRSSQPHFAGATDRIPVFGAPADVGCRSTGRSVRHHRRLHRHPARSKPRSRGCARVGGGRSRSGVRVLPCSTRIATVLDILNSEGWSWRPATAAGASRSGDLRSTRPDSGTEGEVPRRHTPCN